MIGGCDDTSSDEHAVLLRAQPVDVADIKAADWSLTPGRYETTLFPTRQPAVLISMAKSFFRIKSSNGSKVAAAS